MKNILVAALLLASSVAYPAKASRHLLVCEAEKVLPRTPVKSSDIASVGYDDREQVLEVEFVRGAIYQYFGVPASIYKGLMAAISHGTYLAEYVKQAGYRYKRVR